MNTYFEQSKNDQSQPVGYILIVIVSFLAFIIGQIFSNDLSVAILGHSLLETSVNNNWISFLFRLLPFSFFLGAIILGVKFILKRNIKSLFTVRKSFDWKRFFLSFGMWGLVLLASLVVAYLSGVQFEYNLELSKFIPLVLVSISFLLIQITAEEVFFRGFLLQSLNRIIPIGIVPIIFSGTLFGLMHLGNPEVTKLGYGILAYYIGTGIFFGILTRMDDGLELGMGYHFMNNFFAAIIVTNDWQAFFTDAVLIDHTPPTFGIETFITILLLQPLFLLVFSKIYRWSDWKKKLF